MQVVASRTVFLSRVRKSGCVKIVKPVEDAAFFTSHVYLFIFLFVYLFLLSFLLPSFIQLSIYLLLLEGQDERLLVTRLVASDYRFFVPGVRDKKPMRSVNVTKL